MTKNTRKTQHLPQEWDADLPKGSVFRAVFESIQAFMFLVDPSDGSIVAANRAACEFYGYQPSEVAQLTSTEISLLSRDKLQEFLHSLSALGAVHFVTRHRLKSGQVRDMELDATPITLHSGRACLFFLGHDITERKQVERSLCQREGLLRAILDSAGEGISYKDSSGVYREANPAFCQLVGFPCADILGHRGRDFFDRRSADRNVEMDRRVMDQRAPVTYEVDHLGPEGPRAISVHKSPVCDVSGQCLGVVSISRDITASRNDEAALVKSEGLLRAMLQSAQDCIFVTDENDVLREFNQTFCNHMGRSREELLGRSLTEAFSGEELRIQLSTNALVRETHEPVNFTQRSQHSVQELWLSVVKTAIVDAQGQCLGVVSMGRDITAQRAAEQALRQSECRLASLIRQAPAGVFETDKDGGLVFANERMQRQTGRSLAALTGSKWLARINPEDREGFQQAWQQALTKKREVDQELRIFDARGRSLWVSCRVRPITDANNRFSGYLGVMSDISERKKAEALRADVESVVRHDLKSPLGSMQNAMELLEMLGPLNQEQNQVLAEVRVLATRMQGLISLSLDLHAIEAGFFSPKLEPVDLCAVVEEQRVELRTLLAGKDLVLTMMSDCQGAPFNVLGERRLLDAVFSNLLKNAAEASPDKGMILVRLSRDGDTAEVAIRNEGEIPEVVRERFFEKYATAGKAHGTGLGTYSARLMVRTMGGSLSVDTEEPGATTLTLRLVVAGPDLVSPMPTPMPVPEV